MSPREPTRAENRIWGGCSRAPAHLGSAGSDNGKPKSYERFWALSSDGAATPISEREAGAPDSRFRDRLTEL